MKICILISSLAPGGAQRVAVTLANHWLERGWEVSVLTLANPEQDFYKLDPRVRREALNLDRSSKHNLLRGLINNFHRVIAIRRALKDLRPDLVLGLMTEANVLLALARTGLPLVAIGSDRVSRRHESRISRTWKFMRWWTCRRLQAMVTLTRQHESWYRSRWPTLHVATIPNPVRYPLENLAPFLSPRLLKNAAGAERMILSVGRLSPQKGFDILLRAYSQVKNGHSGWILAIVGDGPERERLATLIERLGITDCAFLPGVAGNLGEWYESSDLYVLPSRYEGFPNVLLEAMSYGLPVLASDCETGPREIVHDEVDGILVPPEDEAALANALSRLMGDPVLREHLGRRAVRVRKQFSIESIAGKWDRLFGQVLPQGLPNTDVPD
jgi:glycosyltransferase involved in cell wall biosynthesis